MVMELGCGDFSPTKVSLIPALGVEMQTSTHYPNQIYIPTLSV